MDKILHNTLDSINEGIAILNEKLEIVYWNNYMEYLTAKNLEKVIHNNLYDVLPSLNKKYFKNLIQDVIKNDCKIFLSAAMHKGVINANRKLNLKISRIENPNTSVIVIEFIDVTNQFLRIEQLKEHVNELYILNEKLKEKEKTINNLAYYDPLTGVANRVLFYKIAEKFYNNSKRHNSLLGLMFIDIDKFKNINDTYGHKIGDEILISVSKILTNSTRKEDLVSRFGGDEFVILLPSLKNYRDIENIASRIVNDENKILKLDENEIKISLSLGISLYPNDGDNIDELIVKADKAMYIAKNKGGNKWFHYTQ